MKGSLQTLGLLEFKWFCLHAHSSESACDSYSLELSDFSDQQHQRIQVHTTPCASHQG